MKKWRLIGGVTLVFVLGMLAGSLGTYLTQRQWSDRFWRDPSARRAAFLDRLTRELRLSDAQRQEFKGIVEDVDNRVGVLIREKRSGIRKILDESFARMKERLDPDQQSRLAELRTRFDAHVKEKRRRRSLP